LFLVYQKPSSLFEIKGDFFEKTDFPGIEKQQLLVILKLKALIFIEIS